MDLRVALLVLLGGYNCKLYAVQGFDVTPLAATRPFRSQPHLASALFMQGSEDGTDDNVSGEGPSMETDSVQEEVPEDPELVALKETIASLESELKSKKSSLGYQLDQAEEYSKAGYARTVAEMENMRRARTSMNTSSKSSATAGILTDFLPVYDCMNELNQKYASDAFGSKYGGLSIAPSFAKMGVQEFTAVEGEQVDATKMRVVASEPSELPKDSILRLLSPGLELEGNVIRPLECVASAGLGEDGPPEEEA